MLEEAENRDLMKNHVKEEETLHEVGLKHAISHDFFELPDLLK